MTNILVTGALGQLGSELENLAFDFKHFNFYFTDKDDLDITNLNEIESFVIKNNIQVIINCAAYTQVDKAEDDKEMADAINHLAVKNLAEIAKAQNCKLIHISTDYVFDGNQNSAYLETAKVNPQSVYGVTKQLGEQAILDVNPKNAIIIRTAWLYSSFGANFVKTMLRLGKEKEQLNVVADQIGSPTYAADLAKAILVIIPKLNNEKAEIYHYSNSGKCSWFEFAKEIFKISAINCEVSPINSSEFKAKAKRPQYSLLNNTKIQSTFDITIPNWKDSLEICLMKLGEK